MSEKIPANFLVLVILIGSVGMLATDIYLPALPEMTQYFHCNQSSIQGSFTVFLLGLALCQLIYGGLCDYFGKKKVVVSGLIIFMLASLLCVYAESLSQFLMYRLLQAIGGGAGSVVSRAIISSRYDRTQAIKIFSTTFPIIGLSAAIAPLIGGYLTFFFSWKSTFYFMAGYGFLALMMVLLFLSEETLKTAPKEKQYEHFNALKGYRDVLVNTDFLGFTFIICAGFAAFRSYTVESPFVFDNHGYEAQEVGRFYVALSAAYIVGNLLAKKFITQMNIERVLGIGFGFFGLGGAAMAIGSHFISLSPYAVILPMAMITLGNGLLFPTGSAGALASVPMAISGTASGLVGALQFLSAALCIHWVGELCQGHAPSLSAFIGVIIFIGLCSFIMLVWRRVGSKTSTT